MLVQPRFVFLRKPLAKQSSLFGQRVEYAPLTVHPTQILGAEEAIEQSMRDVFGRQRTVRTRPTHVLLKRPAERFLRDTDLQRAEPRITAHFGGKRLV
jgi:hypothetical protein